MWPGFDSQCLRHMWIEFVEWVLRMALFKMVRPILFACQICKMDNFNFLIIIFVVNYTDWISQVNVN